MKRLSRSLAVALLTLSLSSVALAGDMHCGVTGAVQTHGSETPSTTSAPDDISTGSDSEDPEENPESVTGVLIYVIQIVLSTL
jgi:hypothetical protein